MKKRIVIEIDVEDIKDANFIMEMIEEECCRLVNEGEVGEDSIGDISITD